MSKTRKLKQPAPVRVQPVVRPEMELYGVRLYIHSKGFWLTVGEVMSHDSGKSWALLQCGKTEDGWELRILG